LRERLLGKLAAAAVHACVTQQLLTRKQRSRAHLPSLTGTTWRLLRLSLHLVYTAAPHCHRKLTARESDEYVDCQLTPCGVRLKLSVLLVTILHVPTSSRLGGVLSTSKAGQRGTCAAQAQHIPRTSSFVPASPWLMGACSVYSSPEKNTGLFWQADTVVLHAPPAYVVVAAAPASGLNVMVPPGMETRVLPKDTCGARRRSLRRLYGHWLLSSAARAGAGLPKT